MIKKGLCAIVCLTVLSAIWAWAAIVTNYNVQTKTTNVGGTVQVRNGVLLSGAGAIRYTNFTTSALVPVTITPAAPTYKISSITVNGATTNYVNQTAAVTVNVQKPAPEDPNRPTVLKTQSVVATFAVASAGQVTSHTWQLQTKNNNAGGFLTITRGSDAAKILYAVGQLTLKNYPDTTPVTIQATANTGYDVEKVLVNGNPAILDGEGKFTITPTSTTKVQTVIAYYTKEKYSVTAGPIATFPGTTPPAPTGTILIPVDPKSATYTVPFQGQVQVTVAPAGVNNLVTSIDVSGGGSPLVTKLDNAGHTTANWVGPVKVTISNITAPVVISATFGKDTTAAMQKNCMGTCHLTKNAAGTAFLYPEVVAGQNAWVGTKHNAKNVDCVSCHQTMPGPNYSTVEAKGNLCDTCHVKAKAAGFAGSTHWTNSFNNMTGQNLYGLGRGYCANNCHFKTTTQTGCAVCHSGQLQASGFVAAGGDAAHSPAKVDFNNTCTYCHQGDHHGGPATEFFASAHWNNHLETGAEFADPRTGNNGVLNANDSYTTTENGAVVTCAYRCHFKPGMYPAGVTPPANYFDAFAGKATTYVAYTDTLNNKTYTRPGGNGCIACHDSHSTQAAGYQTCLTCHTGSKHGVVPNEFWNSKHWKSTSETGPEFANQASVEYGSYTFAGKTQTNADIKLGASVDGVLIANDSYTTTEDGANVTCAYRCHFRPGMGPQKDVPGYLAAGKSTTYVAYSSRASGAKIVYKRPGGDSCFACHDPHGLEASARSTCYTCHAGAKHGWSVKAFEKSKHYTGTYAVFDGMGGPTGEACTACHDAHSTEATYGVGSATTGCQTCHTPGAPYGIYNADMTLKAPHGGGAWEATATGTAKTQYLTQGAICQDCHAHDNNVNAGYAESGHGKVSQDAMNAFNHYTWKDRQNATWGTRQAGNCNRCHTTYGYLAFLNATTGKTRLQLQSGQPQNVLLCITCHEYLEGEGKPMPGLRTNATPNGNGQPLSAGYFALFSSSATAITAGNTKIQVAFPSMGNSNICIPCHSGRATDKLFVETMAKSAAGLKNYSTLQGSTYQHAANIGQSFIGKGAYDYTGKLAAIGASGHVGIGGANGACVACHHTKPGESHSLEVVPSTASCVAAACHPSLPNVEEAKASYDAAVAALDTLIRAKFAPLLASGDSNLAAERAGYWRFGRFGKAPGVAADLATAQKAYGAWYNWQMLTLWDPAAFVHNPKYARQVLNDTILYLAADGVIPGSGSAQRTLVFNAIAANGGTPENQAVIKEWVQAPGCGSCHTQATAFLSTEGFHFGLNYACANCHTEQHQTTTPSCRCHSVNSDGGAAFLAAYKGATCAPCHATNDVHTMKGAAEAGQKCIDCHAAALTHPGTKVADNNGGVRSIVNEFGKWSHHVTGATLQDAHCAACHMEGKVENGAIVMDSTYHMKDAKTYLRNADTDAAMAWDPANPNHTTMDNFCLSCHDANGAVSAGSVAIQGVIVPVAGQTASALNPFGDTISNQYDKMLRGRVVDADGQFNTANASHHAVKGAKYTGRVREGESRVIANPEAFAANSSATLFGERKTIYEAGRFVATYRTLGATGVAAELGDDSTLHCGDCHTVGQFKPGSAVNADGSATTVVIGAHGSENEYMLRNSIGSDELHRGAQYSYAPANMTKGAPFAGVKEDGTEVNIANQAVPADEVPTAKPFLVCYNCHVYAEYGSVYFSNTANGGREGSHAEGDHTRGNYCNGPYNTSGSGRATTYTAVYGKQITGTTGTFMGVTNFNFGRLQPGTATNDLAGGTTGPTSATLLAAGMNGSGAGGNNIFQIQCANCHNAGLNQGFGGIHGSKVNTYTDGNGNGQLPRRFLPGLGNVGFVPGDPSIAGDAKWEQEKGTAGPGCYTLSTATTSSAKNLANPTNEEAGGNLNPGSGQAFGTWGACTDHGSGAGTKTGIAGDGFDRTIIRPVSY